MLGAFKALGKIPAKSWKAMKGAMGEVKGAAGGLSGIMDFMKNLKILNIIFKPISALIKVFMNAILVPLIPVLQPIFDGVMAMIPMFEKIGGLIGEGLADVLGVLIPVIMDIIMTIMEAVMPALEEIIPMIMEIIMILVEAAIPVIEELMPFIIMIISLIGELLVAFMPILVIVAKVIGMLMSLLTKSGVLSIIMKAILFVLEPLTRFLTWIFGILENILTLGMGSFQAGTRDVGAEPTLAVLHPHEAVLTATEARELAMGKPMERGAKRGGGNIITVNIDMKQALIPNEAYLAEKIREVLWEES